MTTDKRFAVLIDADNISDRYIKTILDEMAGEGEVTYKRIVPFVVFYFCKDAAAQKYGCRCDRNDLTLFPHWFSLQ